MTDASIGIASPARPVKCAIETRGGILAVGLSAAQARELPSRLFGALGKAVIPTGYHDLTAERLGGAMAVLSPLVGPGFDAVDLAIRLHRSGFQGRYFAFASYLPDAQVVLREVAAVAPGLEIEIIGIGQGPHLVISSRL
jgi:hypothetical protein